MTDMITQRLSQLGVSEGGTRCFSINELPVEVITEIFRMCIVGQGGITPFKLARICSGWRELILNAPELWAVVHLRFQPRIKYKRKNLLTLLEQWIKYAQDLPLVVLFDDFHHVFKFDHFDKIVVGIVELVSTRASQLKSLTLAPVTEHAAVCLHDAANLQVGSWPLLSHLALELYHVPYFSTLLDLGDQKLDYTSFHHLSDLTLAKLRPTMVKLSWNTLVTVHLLDVPVSDITHVLRNATHLRGLTAHEMQEEDRTIEGTRHGDITQTSLRHLTYSETGSYGQCRGAQRMFRTLCLPALETLAVELGYERPNRGYMLDITRTISKSLCSLQSLSLQGIALHEQTFISLLHCVPSLRHIRLSENAWFTAMVSHPTYTTLGPAVFQAMTMDKDLPHTLALLLPNLETFVLEGSQVASTVPEAVIAMLNSRSQPGSDRISMKSAIFRDVFDQDALVDHADMLRCWQGRGCTLILA